MFKLPELLPISYIVRYVPFAMYNIVNVWISGRSFAQKNFDFRGTLKNIDRHKIICIQSFGDWGQTWNVHKIPVSPNILHR